MSLAKKVPERKAPAKKIVSAKKPAAKAIIKNEETEKLTATKNLALPSEQRIITAEGLRRKMIQNYKEGKKG